MARWNRSLTWLAAMILMLVTASGTSNADPPAATSHANESASDLFVPRRHQFDLELSDISGIVDNSSLIRRREASIAGSALHFGPDLGVGTMQIPEVTATWWVTALDSVQFQFRYFALYGGSHLDQPITFNGDVIAPGQDISTSGTQWFTAGFYYQRRITPLIEPFQAALPSVLRNWDLRPLIGLEFVYLDFKINGGHPSLLSGTLDARGRWHDQELPVPTIGLDARHWLGNDFVLQITAQGNWINKWNSLRTQDGTVYLSQSSFENHWRVYWLMPALRRLRPFLGFTFYYYKQTETSREIGNLARLMTYGPELGASYSF